MRFACLFLLYTAFGPVSRRQPLVRSLSRRRHGTQLLRAAANGRHPRGHHRFPGKRQKPGFTRLPASRTSLTSAAKSSPTSSTTWPRAKTIVDRERLYASFGARPPAREQGEGLVTKRLRGAAAHRRARWVLGQVRGVLPLPPPFSRRSSRSHLWDG